MRRTTEPELKNADFAVLGSAQEVARAAAAGTAFRAERTMASVAPSEPPDGELTKQCSFSKGGWADEYPVDVGFGNIYPLFGTPENAGFDLLTARGLLAAWRTTPPASMNRC